MMDCSKVGKLILDLRKEKRMTQKELADTGDLEPNDTDGGNMKRIKFYVCPTCGNALSGTGEAEISCCGRKLNPLIAQPESASHELTVSQVEDDLYITLQHEMTKEHYISFVAYVSYDRMLFIKLYPEQPAEVRFPKMHGGDIYYYCNQHGLIKKAKKEKQKAGK